MINSPAGRLKLEAICDRISKVWADRERLEAEAMSWPTLQAAHTSLCRYEGLGGFMAYEIACDLQHTRWLEKAADVNTWANPGPGAIRGMYRLLGRPIPNKSNATAPGVPPEWTETIITLRTELAARHPDWPAVEAREIEQSLCEYDKYCRLALNEGKAKRTYAGAGGGLF